jgi:hypothetical protein
VACNLFLQQPPLSGRRVMRLKYRGWASVRRYRQIPTGEGWTMEDRSNEQSSCIELTDEELTTISGSAADIATFFQMLSNCLRMMSGTQKSIIANLR